MRAVVCGVLAAVMALAAMDTAQLATVEGAINDRFRSNATDPYDLLGRARGSYLPGYGAVFTIELNLVSLGPLAFSPFSGAAPKQDLAALRDRKVKKLALLRADMRELMLNAGVTLTGIPAGEKVTMEAFLFNYRAESTAGLPHKVVMTADRQKLAEARAGRVSGADLAALIVETEY